MESSFSSSTQDVFRPAMRNQDSVRMDRDRFLAFSFCGADVLVELNEDRQITFSAGALITLAEQSSSDVLGIDLETLFVPGDRLLVTELLNRMKTAKPSKRLWSPYRMTGAVRSR